MISTISPYAMAGMAVTVPPVPRWDVWLLDEHVLIFGRAEGRELDALGQQPPPDLVALPDELYLRRFLSLDASDAEQVRSFCADYGMVGALDMSDFPFGALWDATALLADPETGVEQEMPLVAFEETASPALRETMARLESHDKDGSTTHSRSGEFGRFPPRRMRQEPSRKSRPTSRCSGTRSPCGWFSVASKRS